MNTFLNIFSNESAIYQTSSSKKKIKSKIKIKKNSSIYFNDECVNLKNNLRVKIKINPISFADLKYISQTFLKCAKNSTFGGKSNNLSSYQKLKELFGVSSINFVSKVMLEILFLSSKKNNKKFKNEVNKNLVSKASRKIYYPISFINKKNLYSPISSPFYKQFSFTNKKHILNKMHILKFYKKKKSLKSNSFFILSSSISNKVAKYKIKKIEKKNNGLDIVDKKSLNREKIFLTSLFSNLSIPSSKADIKKEPGLILDNKSSMSNSFLIKLKNLENKGQAPITSLISLKASYSKLSEIKFITIALASSEKIREWAEKTLPNGKVLGQVTNPNTLHHKTFKAIKGGLFCDRIFGPLQDFQCACGLKKKNQSNQISKNIGKTPLNTISEKTLILTNGKFLGANTFHDYERSSYKPISRFFGKTFKPNKGGLFCDRIFGPLPDFQLSGQFFNKSRILKKIITPSLSIRKFCPSCDVEYTFAVVRRYQLGYIQLAAPVTHVWYLKANPSYLSMLFDMKKKALESIIYCSKTMTLEISLKGTQSLRFEGSPASLFNFWKTIISSSQIKSQTKIKSKKSNVNKHGRATWSRISSFVSSSQWNKQIKEYLLEIKIKKINKINYPIPSPYGGRYAQNHIRGKKSDVPWKVLVQPLKGIAILKTSFFKLATKLLGINSLDVFLFNFFKPMLDQNVKYSGLFLFEYDNILGENRLDRVISIGKKKNLKVEKFNPIILNSIISSTEIGKTKILLNSFKPMLQKEVILSSISLGDQIISSVQNNPKNLNSIFYSTEKGKNKLVNLHQRFPVGMHQYSMQPQRLSPFPSWKKWEMQPQSEMFWNEGWSPIIKNELSAKLMTHWSQKKIKSDF